MTIAVTATFKTVQDALGKQGSMNPLNVKKAAKVLDDHAKKFSELESKCVYMAGQLQTVIDEIKPKGG